MSKDDRENWRLRGPDHASHNDYFIELGGDIGDRTHRQIGRIYEREDAEIILASVNALQGIPTDQLGEVKKAWLFCKLQNHMFDRDGRAMICGNGKVKDAVEIVEGGWICVGPDETIIAAKTLRSRGADFGELNALLDSVQQKER